MDIEWAKDGIDGRIYVVQARPETVKSRDARVIERYRLRKRGEVVAEGRAVGQKIAAGPARLIADVDRMNELSFNSSLMREMRAIAFVKKLLAEERVPRGRYKDLHIHTIEAEAAMRQLGYSSKLNADATFLSWLFKLGRERAQLFLEQHRDKIGRESSTDIEAKFL